MTNDKQPMQASGQGTDRDAPDGISKTPGADGKGTGGDSLGGAYENPHSGKPPQDGFMGHGGQTNLEDRSKSGEQIDETGTD